MLLLGQIIIYLAALSGILAGSLGLIYFGAGAFARARRPEQRRRSAALASAALLVLLTAAVGGFFGVGALLYVGAR